MKNTTIMTFLGGSAGTAVSATGTALQPNEVLQIISLVITILGAIITTGFTLWTWWKNAKKDGKIDEDEVKEAIDILQDGGEKIKEALDDKKEGDNK